MKMETILKQMKLFDLCSYEHSINVGILAHRFSEYLNAKFLSNIDTCLAKLCGEYHDIGKMKLNHEILNKTSKLTDEEFIHIKKHPEFGVEYIQSEELLLPEEVVFCVLYHHKGFKNNGYPAVDVEIPAHVMNYIDIIAICDIFEALTHKRPYKENLSLEKSLDIMSKSDINPFLYHNFKDFVQTNEIKLVI